MKIRLLQFLGLIQLLFGHIKAQDYQLAGVSFLTYPYSGVKDATNDSELSFREYGAFVNIPYKFKNDKSILVNSLGYGSVSVNGRGLPMEELHEINMQLQALYYQIMFAHKLKNNWRVVANIRPTLASDFKERLNGDDFVLLGAAFASKKVSENFGIGGGFVYTTRFGKPFAIPVVPMNYKMGRHRISALFPIKLAYKYSIGEKEKLKIGLKQAINGAQFNIASINDVHYSLPQFDKIRYSRINFGGMISYKFASFIQLEVNGGVSTRRRYNLLGASSSTYEFNLKASPFLQLSLALIPTRQK